MKNKSIVDYVKKQQEKNRKDVAKFGNKKVGAFGNEPRFDSGSGWLDMASDEVKQNRMSDDKRRAFDANAEYEAIARKLGLHKFEPKLEEVDLDEGKLPDMRDALMQVRAEKPVQLDEEVELDEMSPKDKILKKTANHLQALIRGSNLPDDNAAFSAVRDYVEAGNLKIVADIVKKLDTDPKEAIINAIAKGMGKKEAEKLFKVRITRVEEVELDEAKYELYHKDFSSAMQHAYKMAKKLHGITVDPKEIDDKVASGPRKPSEGKTNSYRLEGDKGAIQVQVYNKGGSKPYELNFYKEEVEIDEAKVLAKKGNMQVINDDGVIKLMKGSKVVSSGDYDRGAGVFFMGAKQQSFDSAEDILKMKEEVELDEFELTEAVSVKDFDSIKKGDTVTIKYESAMSSGSATFKVTAKNMVGKGKKVEKVTMKSTKNPGGVKFFLYKRDNKVGFAIGDMGASVVSFKKEETILGRIDRKLKERKNG